MSLCHAPPTFIFFFLCNVCIVEKKNHMQQLQSGLWESLKGVTLSAPVLSYVKDVLKFAHTSPVQQSTIPQLLQNWFRQQLMPLNFNGRNRPGVVLQSARLLLMSSS